MTTDRPPSLRIPVVADGDAGAARRAARALALRLGFDEAGAEAVALSVTELATNLLRYAVEGEIALAAVEGARGPGVQIESRDRGPGMADVGRAMEDGYSTGGGLGGGLGAVRRLMDEFEIASGPEGTRIVARAWPSRR